MQRVIFAGTPYFALPALQALLDSSHTICVVYTTPDRPSGRGQKLTSSPVKELALDNNLFLIQPLTLKDPQVQQHLVTLRPEILINVAYGLLLPPTVLTLPKFGCINIHPSLLPRWRGAAPIQHAILAGDTTTGVSIMEMDAGLDTGAIYKQETIPIAATDTTDTLSRELAILGSKLLLEVLDDIENYHATLTPQNDTLSTYANKINKEDGKINWHKSAKEIDCMIRAFNPWPVAYTNLDGKPIRVWQAQVVDQHTNSISTHKPGTIIHMESEEIDVATGDGILRLLQLQFPGGKVLHIKDILNAQHKYFSSSVLAFTTA